MSTIQLHAAVFYLRLKRHVVTLRRKGQVAIFKVSHSRFLQFYSFTVHAVCGNRQVQTADGSLGVHSARMVVCTVQLHAAKGSKVQTAGGSPTVERQTTVRSTQLVAALTVQSAGGSPTVERHKGVRLKQHVDNLTVQTVRGSLKVQRQRL